MCVCVTGWVIGVAGREVLADQRDPRVEWATFNLVPAGKSKGAKLTPAEKE